MNKREEMLEVTGRLMSNRRILFRIPFTLYWLAWDNDLKKFLLATKRFDAKLFQETNGYYFRFIC